MKNIKVAEIFAGVGGFRIGLERASKRYEVVWSNQWEPATKKQHASEIYVSRFGEKNHSNANIAQVPIEDIPDHDLLVGGFPCQDYSVARTLSQAKGITGKKGVLWWQIHRIIKDSRHKPKLIFLENVDRLLVSPAKQRGRYFAIMLASLSDLGYAVEWRIINAADYGMPQRRRRIFILGYHKDSHICKQLSQTEPSAWMLKEGTLAESFKIDPWKTNLWNRFNIEGDLVTVSESFNKKGGISPFRNCGLMKNRKVYTAKVYPSYKGPRMTLGDVLLPEKEVPSEYFINGSLER